MVEKVRYNRREWLATVSAAALVSPTRARAADQKRLRGAFMILATPYKKDGAIDYQDLQAEVEFLDRCGVQGLVWPQNASDLLFLSRDERMRGMEVLAESARGRSPALVLGVQAEDTQGMLAYAEHAEKLNPDAVIAIPPTQATSLDHYREYYSALAETSKRPVFIQTAGGAPEVEPTVEFLVEMARKHSHLGYLKEEYGDSISRMRQLAKYHPSPIKIILGAHRARAWTYEMRLGMDGTLTGGPMYGDVYARIWKLHLENRRSEVLEVFSKLMLMTNLERQIPGLRNYMMKRRGVFKTAVSRRGDYSFSPDAVAEIEYNWAALKPYLQV